MDCDGHELAGVGEGQELRHRRPGQASRAAAGDRRATTRRPGRPPAAPVGPSRERDDGDVGRDHVEPPPCGSAATRSITVADAQQGGHAGVGEPHRHATGPGKPRRARRRRGGRRSPARRGRSARPGPGRRRRRPGPSAPCPAAKSTGVRSPARAVRPAGRSRAAASTATMSGGGGRSRLQPGTTAAAGQEGGDRSASRAARRGVRRDAGGASR